MRNLLLTTSLFGAATSWAHPGHGLPGFGHWHATDPWGFVALAIAVGAALWWTQGRR